tara:strand:+ start:72263 stop:72370 length:108 start_codon:yes stop_codon:yes gene_type:complete
MKKKNTVVVVLIVLTLVAIWIELAVGLFGTPWAGT